MHIRIIALLICFATCTGAACGQAQNIAISRIAGGNASSLVVQRNLVSNGEWEIDITVSGGANDVVVTIRPQTATNPYVIRYIKIRSVRNGLLNNTAQIIIDENGGGVISHIRSIEKASASPFSNAEVVLSSVTVSGTLGDPGSAHTSAISADVVGTLIAGSITADVNAGPRQFGAASSITEIRAFNGPILGHVLAPTGSIAKLRATHTTTGDLGASANPINIWAKQVVGEIEGKTIYANIDSTYSGGNDDVWNIKTRNGGFYGSLRCRDLNNTITTGGLDIAGPIDADITILRDVRSSIVTSAAMEPGRLIRVGRDFTAAANLDTLEGQIIINADNAGAGDWTGAFTINGVTIDDSSSPPYQAPFYNLTSASLGGGSIGVVPFALNDVDCTPTNDDTGCGVALRRWYEEEEFDRETIILNFYGPVLDASASGIVPVEVEALDLSCPAPPAPCTNVYNSITSTCEVRVAPPGYPRQVWISLIPTGSPAAPVSFASGFRYKVTPTLDGLSRTNLRSDGTGLVNPPDITSFTYETSVMCTPPAP